MDNQLEQQVAQLLGTVAGGTKLSIECSTDDAQWLFEHLRTQHTELGAVLFEEKLNERLTVQGYLAFFAELWGKKGALPAAIQAMQLADLQGTVLRKLSMGQLRRVSFAREVLHAAPVYYFQEPLRGIPERDAEILLAWMLALPAGTALVCTSSSAMDALRLPGEAWRLEDTLEKMDAPLPTAPTFVVDKIPAKQGDSVFLFNPAELDYAESAAGRTDLHVASERYACTLTLDELEKKLAQYGFYRCHRSYLVNMQKVREVLRWTRNSYSLRLEDAGQEIPLSKGRIEQMRSLYGF